MPMFSFHFDCGDSNDGPVGFCARVKAETKEKALQILKNTLPTEVKARPASSDEKENGAIEYIEIYLNPDRITLNDIDDGEEVEDGA